MYNSNAKHVFYYCSKLHNLRQKFIFALGNEVVSIIATAIAIALPKLDWTLQGVISSCSDCFPMQCWATQLVNCIYILSDLPNFRFICTTGWLR